MQVFKFLRNKLAGDDTSGLAIEIDGVPLTREQLLQLKQTKLEEMARERDPKKNDELACGIAQIESAIKAFEPIAEIRAQAARRRHELNKLDMAALSAGQQQFYEECGVIAGRLMRRAGDRAETYKFTYGEKDWHSRCAKVFDAVYASLTFEQATAQFNEICNADRERRDWQDVVPLPTLKTDARSFATVVMDRDGILNRAVKVLAGTS